MLGNDDIEKHYKLMSNAVGRIGREFNAAFDQIPVIRRRMRELEEDGMYDAVPTESWETRRGGDYEYLYMIFPKIDGLYTGPGYRRKLYVGCKDERIDEARRLKRNRAEYETLAETLDELEKWLLMLRLRLMGAAMMAEERPELPGNLAEIQRFDQWSLEQANG